MRSAFESNRIVCLQPKIAVSKIKSVEALFLEISVHPASAY